MGSIMEDREFWLEAAAAVVADTVDGVGATPVVVGRDETGSEQAHALLVQDIDLPVLQHSTAPLMVMISPLPAQAAAPTAQGVLPDGRGAEVAAALVSGAAVAGVYKHRENESEPFSSCIRRFW